MAITLEQFVNNVATTLNGAINNSVTSITITSATGFPSTGNFRIVIDTEIMLVTARSGTTLTVSRGAEGTSAASHLDLADVTVILSRDALAAGIGDFYLNGAFSDRPTAGKKGRRFIPTDWEGVGYYDDGTNWNLILPDGQILPELTSDGLTTGVSMGSYSSLQGFLRVVSTSGGEPLRIRYKSVSPSTSITVTMCCKPSIFSPGDQVVFGPFFSRSSDDHSYLVGLNHDGSWKTSHFYYSNFTTFGANDSQVSFLKPLDTVVWMRAVFIVATNEFQLYFSYDGKTWVKYSQATNGNMSGANRAGFTFDRFGSTFVETVNLDIYYLNVTAI